MAPTRYCHYCGGHMVPRRTESDPVARLSCSVCTRVLYENPKILVACFASWGTAVLWIKRATQPYKGLWSIPGGFMELGESPHQAAARELFEETGAEIASDNLQIFQIGYIDRINQVYLVFRGQLDKPEYHTSEEASEVALFAEDEVPWESFANPEIETSIRYFYHDLRRGEFGVYEGQLVEEKHRFRPVTKD